ncbi:unnamed protein product [Polarella glacialis]|uniref:Uncharacterized protein n=1 Tax=Polarella glacialis TaxID=89957 RepID=A0A813DM81_POLGL|nr:unnamed protein product [Polarella glacialis]
MAHDWRHELEIQVAQASKAVQLLSEEMRQAKASASKAQCQVGELSSRGGGSRLEDAGEAADIVEALAREWDVSFGERVARCDAASEGCERCVKVMEDRLRSFSSELRLQLVSEGEKLMDVLTPSLQVGKAEPLAAATAAAAAAAAEVFAAADERGSPQASFLRMSPLASSPARSPLRMFAASAAGTMEGGDGNANGLLASLSKRVTDQEQSMEELRRHNASLRSEMDGYQLEQKVTRSLAGLERRS